MANIGHTTNIFVDTKDYFAADLDNGNVRIGLFGGAKAFDLPPHHKYFNFAKNCTTSDEVENLFDKMMDNF